METIGALAVKIGADSTELIAAFGKAEKAVSAHEFSLLKAGKAAGAFAAAALAVAGTLVAFAKAVTNSAEEIAKLAEKIGVTVESMSTLKYAAYIADVSMEELAVSLRFLNKNMAEAQAGSEELRNVFKLLKVQFEAAPGVLRATDAVLMDLAEKFYRMEDGAGKTAIAIKLFGRSGSDLIPFLNLGRDGIEQLKEEARKLGIELDTNTAKKAMEFQDSLKKMLEMAKAAGREFAGPFVEAQTKAMNAMIEARKAGEGLFAAWAAGMKVFLFGTQIEQWTKSMDQANNKLAAAKRELAAAETAAKSPNAQFWPEAAAQSVAKYVEKVRSAQAEVDKLTSQKPPDPNEEKPKDDKKGKEKAPPLPDEKKIREAEQKAQEVRDVIHKVNEENDKRALDQVALQNKAVEEATKAGEDNILQINEQAIAQKDEMDLARFERVKALKEFEFKTLEEMENEAHKAKLDQLAQFTDEELEVYGGRMQMIQELNNDHTMKMNDIQARGTKTRLDFEKAGWQRQTATVFGELQSITAGVAQHNRGMFELNKVAGIANAIINTARGITNALAAYPPPLSFAMAAAQAAAGLIQIQAIRSAQFGSGTAPSAAGTPAPAVTPVTNDQGSSSSGGKAGGGMTTIVNLPGTDLLETKAVRALLEKLNEGMRDGGRILLQ